MTDQAVIRDLAILLNSGRWLNVSQLLGPDAGMAMDRLLKRLDNGWNQRYEKYGSAFGATESGLREMLR